MPGRIQDQAHLTVPGPLLSLNTVIDAAKRHWSVYAKEKRGRTSKVALLAQAARLKPMTGRVTVRFCWYAQSGRVDPDNLQVNSKWCLDGLVEAGVLEDDGWTTIAGVEHEFHIDTANPRVEIGLRNEEI